MSLFQKKVSKLIRSITKLNNLQFGLIEDKYKNSYENKSPVFIKSSASRGVTMRYPSVQNPLKFHSQRKFGPIPKYMKMISNQPSHKIIKASSEAALLMPSKKNIIKLK